MNTKEITAQSTMQEVLEAYPAAQRALFRKYHIGGCSSCGFQPTDALEEVLKSHNVMDEVIDVVSFIQKSQEEDAKIQMSPKEVAQALKMVVEQPLNGTNGVKLLDVREESERDTASIEGSRLMDQTLAQEMMSAWPKDTQIVFFCHHGNRSLDAAAYFAGHGFKNAKSMAGGIDAWSCEVDSKVPRY